MSLVGDVVVHENVLSSPEWAAWYVPQMPEAFIEEVKRRLDTVA